MAAVARAERVAQTEILGFQYAAVDTVQKLRSFDALAGRIFRLSPPDSLSARVMAKYLEICVRDKLIEVEEGEIVLPATIVAHFNKNLNPRVQALATTMAELKSALVQEPVTRHVKAQVQPYCCYFEVVTSGTDGLSDRLASATIRA